MTRFFAIISELFALLAIRSHLRAEGKRNAADRKWRADAERYGPAGKPLPRWALGG